MPRPDLEPEVPYGEDLQDPAGAQAWAAAADQKRPFRAAFRERFAELVSDAGARRVLELGGGPGLLARCVLERCPRVSDYVLVDYSEPMLAMARERLAGFGAARLLLGDFRTDSWLAEARAPFDGILAMQSVHELRHKRHAAGLYTRLRELLAPGGVLLVCDHTPKNDAWPAAALCMTEQEQLGALAQAGLACTSVVKAEQGLVLCRAQRAE